MGTLPAGDLDGSVTKKKNKKKQETCKF